MAQVQLSEREVRIQKTQKLQAMGIHPYAQSFHKTHLIKDIIATYNNLPVREIETIIEAPEVQVKTAGRVMLYRSHGKLAFAKILDSTEQIQLMFHRDQCKIIKTEKKADGSMEDTAIESLDFPESET
jgi:lysine--tRNA ligase